MKTQEERRAYGREYAKKNREKLRAKAHERWITNPQFRKERADYQRKWQAKNMVLDPTPKPPTFDMKAYRHEWYLRNKEKMREYNRAYGIRNRDRTTRRKRELAAERKAELVKMFGGKCMDCGFVGEPYIYHFDHREPDTKQNEVGAMLNTRDWGSIVAEAKECDLVCQNCHAVRTHNSDKVHRKLMRAMKLRRVAE